MQIEFSHFICGSNVIKKLPASLSTQGFYAHRLFNFAAVHQGKNQTPVGVYCEPSRIADDRKIKVVFFKENLSTGWDCPRAETMMSFRHANDAMAFGCSIITTPNDGVKEYCEDGNNCLMIQMENPIDLADKIIHLYRDYNLRHSLISGGLITAKQFDWTNIVPELLRYYKKVAEYRPIIS